MENKAEFMVAMGATCPRPLPDGCQCDHLLTVPDQNLRSGIQDGRHLLCSGPRCNTLWEIVFNGERVNNREQYMFTFELRRAR